MAKYGGQLDQIALKSLYKRGLKKLTISFSCPEEVKYLLIKALAQTFNQSFNGEQSGAHLKRVQVTQIGHYWLLLGSVGFPGVRWALLLASLDRYM